MIRYRKVLRSAGALVAGPALAKEKPAAPGVGVTSFTSGGTAAYGKPERDAAELMIEGS